jgi:hypothetical protein
VDSVANNRIEALFVRQVEPAIAESTAAAGTSAAAGQDAAIPAGGASAATLNED